MKKIIFIGLAFLFPLGLLAQRAAVVKVDASLVPDAVKQQQATKYPGVTVERWDKKIVTSRKGVTVTRFVAVFSLDNQRVKARYAPDGTPLTASLYLRPDMLPQPVTDACKNKYPGMTITAGEKITVFKTGREVYRIRLRKANAVTIVCLNPDGTDVETKMTQEELSESANEE